MNLSLKERYKVLGKFGFVFLIIYYLILGATIIFNIILIYDSVRYEMFDEYEIIALVLFILNACTLWKLNKLSFWSTIISVIGLGYIYGYMALLTLLINALAISLGGSVDFNARLLEVFLYLITIFLLIFLVFISIKREVFGFKGKSNDID